MQEEYEEEMERVVRFFFFFSGRFVFYTSLPSALYVIEKLY